LLPLLTSQQMFAGRGLLSFGLLQQLLKLISVRTLRGQLSRRLASRAGQAGAGESGRRGGLDQLD
jgi:hypothetical protein